MIVLFIHQNGPAQYIHLASHLSGQPGTRVLLLTQKAGAAPAGVEEIVYRPDPGALTGCHPYNTTHEAAVRTGLAVLAACRRLRHGGVIPDVIVGHSGWGETLLLKHAFPDTPVLAYFEYYYHAEGADIGYDSEFAPARPGDAERLWLRNSINHLSLMTCDRGHTATQWQRSLFPEQWQGHIEVLHEGIDTEEVRPDPQAVFTLANGSTLAAEDEVITYVARNLEPYRGFHYLMRALPAVLDARPNAQVVMVGEDGPGYGDLPPYGGSWRLLLQAELGSQLDLSRIHFVGRLSRSDYLSLLQVSSLHIYFSYPFVLSWSCLEAMAAGCLVLGADVPSIKEVIAHGRTGYLVDMRESRWVSEGAITLLSSGHRHEEIRAAARAEVIATYDLRRRALPKWMHTLDTLAQRR